LDPATIALLVRPQVEMEEAYWGHLWGQDLGLVALDLVAVESVGPVLRVYNTKRDAKNSHLVVLPLFDLFGP